MKLKLLYLYVTITLMMLIITYIALKRNIKPKIHKKLEYWEVHDKFFLKYANLKYFNKEIKKYTLKEENMFLTNILLNSPNRSVFLDIGAYNGDTCLEIAEFLKTNNRSDIQILAFEPKKKLCDLINKKANKNQYNLQCVNIVLSNKKGILYNKKEEGAGNMFNEKFHGDKYNSDTLDNILDDLKIQNIYLMKIDVEGHEAEVLEGAYESLKKTEQLYIELWNDDHAKQRNPAVNNSHNKNVLQLLDNFFPIQKIEKNIYFKKLD